MFFNPIQGFNLKTEFWVVALLLVQVILAQEKIINFLDPKPNATYFGNDIAVNGQIGVNTSTTVGCAEICSSFASTCMWFVYYSASPDAHKCYPKTEMIFATKPPAGSVTYAYFNAPPTLANLSFSGPVQGFDYYGNDIAENGTIGFFETTASGCANICNAHSNSVGFVYFAENFVGNIYGSYGVVN